MITDAIMPGMRGHELGEVMRKLRPQIKVLFISGYTDDAAIHQGVLVEGIQFLQKPFTPDALALKVRTVLDMG
jgi:two-component system, cell cycle sensor histidine kinase and response regulator CckA